MTATVIGHRRQPLVTGGHRGDAAIPSLRGVAGPWSFAEFITSALEIGGYSAVVGVMAIGVDAMLRNCPAPSAASSCFS